MKGPFFVPFTSLMSVRPTIVTIGSHSALDICRGAKTQGFSTLVVTEEGREKTYSRWFATQKNLGCVDATIPLKHFRDILEPTVQKKLKRHNVVFVPNRSFEVYINDYDAIETRFSVPMFGNKFLLRTEERAGKLTQYDLLREAGIRIPRQFDNPNQIDRLVIVKTYQKERSYERAFFFAQSPKEFHAAWKQLTKSGLINDTKNPLIEEYVVGVQVNLNFFYSPLSGRLELLGTDTRRQTNVAGLVNLPARDQLRLPETLTPSFEEAGHIAVTILESLLEPAFTLGERFVSATQKLCPPGIIGPFSLQACVVPEKTKKEFVVFDVSPRMPGSPGISATPYSAYLFGKPMSVGERIALEIREAIKKRKLDQVTS